MATRPRTRELHVRIVLPEIWKIGRVWLIAPALKAGNVRTFVGSNPTSSVYQNLVESLRQTLLGLSIGD